VAASRSRPALDTLTTVAGHWLREAADLCARISQASQDHERGQHEQRQAEAARKARITAWRTELRQVTGDAARLETLWRKTGHDGKPPFRVLAATRINGTPLLTFTPGTSSRTGLELSLSILSHLSEALASGHSGEHPGAPRGKRHDATSGTWTVPGTSIRYPGNAEHCRALAAWDAPATRQVIEHTLIPLHAREDQLAAALGIPVRPGCLAMRPGC
jgi:hypothetical protein